MIGLRILPPPAAKASAELAARFRLLPVANVSGRMNRMHAGGAREEQLESVRCGTSDRAWVDAALRRLGVLG